MSSSPPRNALAPLHDDEIKVFTVFCGDEAYGLPIDFVQTIFRVDAITPVPLAPPEIVGLINLRGKINTAASLRLMLGMPDNGEYVDALAICLERRGEHFALIVDRIGDLVSVSEQARIHEPPNVSKRRTSMTTGVFRLDHQILPVLDVDALLDFGKDHSRSGPGDKRELAQ